MKRVLTSIATALLVLSLAACSSADQAVLKAVDEGKYLDASSTYAEKVIGDIDAEREVAEGIKERIDTAIDGYNAETISYNEALAIFERIEKSNVYNASTLAQAKMMLERIAESKRIFALAESFMEDGNYWDAYLHYDFVASEDTNFETAQSKRKEAKEAYRDAIINSAEAEIEKENFDAAFSAFDNTQIPFDNDPKFSTAIQNCSTAYSEYIIALAEEKEKSGKYLDAVTIIDDAAWPEKLSDEAKQMRSRFTQEYVDDIISSAQAKQEESNYIDALAIYDAAIDKIGVTPKLTQARAACVTSYVEKVKQEATDAFGDAKNYEAAIQILQKALGVVGENGTLTSEVQRYQKYIPVALTSLEPIQKGEYIAANRGTSSTLKGIDGSNYPSDSVIEPTSGGKSTNQAFLEIESEADSSITYYLNYNYDTFSGLFVVPYSMLNCPISPDSWGPWNVLEAGGKKYMGSPVSVKIYGDDILLYELSTTTKETYDPISFSLDVSGVKNLRIMMQGIWAKFGYPATYYPDVCMTEAYIQK